MAFVRIVKMVGKRVDGEPLKVSKSAYDHIYKKRGYSILREENEKTQETKKQEQEEYEEEIPISEMNKEQLMKFAKEHDIDTSQAKSVRDARQIVQKAVREHNM